MLAFFSIVLGLWCVTLDGKFVTVEQGENGNVFLFSFKSLNSIYFQGIGGSFKMAEGSYRSGYVHASLVSH
jgi:hypothetical protein